MQRISLTPSEFDVLRPLNGHIIVSSSVDVGVVGETDLILDTTYKPENHQEIQNIVVKVPEKKSFVGEELISEIEVCPGDEVIINYFPILNAPIIEVGDRIYRMVPYLWTIMDVGKKKMLGDWVLVDKLREIIDTDLEMQGKISEHYFEVVMPWQGKFRYTRRSSRYLDPKKGDIVCLLDSAVFALEDDLHLHFDGHKHYVAKAWKIMGIVETDKYEKA